MMLNERIPHSPRSSLRWRLGLTAVMCLVCAALIVTPLVGVVAAEEPRPTAAETESTTAETDPASVPDATRGSAKARATARPGVRPRARSTTRPDPGRAGKDEVVPLRITVKGDCVVIETADGQRIEAKEIVALSTSHAGRTSFYTVRRRDGQVFIAPSFTGAYAPPTGTRRSSIRPAGVPQEVNVYPLRHVRAAEAVQVLARLLGGGTAVKFDTLTDSNAVVVRATKADMEPIQELLKRLDVAASAPATGEKAAPKKGTEPTPKVRDAQLRVLLGEAERRVIDLEANVKLAEVNLVRVKLAQQSGAASRAEIDMAKIKLEAAKKKFDLAKQELEELQEMVGKPAGSATRAAGSRSPGSHAPRTAPRRSPYAPAVR